MHQVAKWLGHEDAATLLRIYAHVPEEQTTEDFFAEIQRFQLDTLVVAVKHPREGEVDGSRSGMKP